MERNAGLGSSFGILREIRLARPSPNAARPEVGPYLEVKTEREIDIISKLREEMRTSGQ